MQINTHVQHILHTLVQQYPMLAPCQDDIQTAFSALYDCYASGGKLLLCGNGGSAADCDHITGELMKGFLKSRPLDSALCGAIDGMCTQGIASRLQGGLPAINLCAHTALITAISNDLGGDVIYAQQVVGYGRTGDVLLGLSTSGNAQNVCSAVAAARAKGLCTIGMTGRAGGRLRELCDIAICVPADSTPAIQELHLPVYHALCAMVEAAFFAE